MSAIQRHAPDLILPTLAQKFKDKVKIISIITINRLRSIYHILLSFGETSDHAGVMVIAPEGH